jgi:hypothetical protein
MQQKAYDEARSMPIWELGFLYASGLVRRVDRAASHQDVRVLRALRGRAMAIRVSG